MKRQPMPVYCAKFYDVNGRLKDVQVQATNHVAARLLIVDRPDFDRWHTTPFIQSSRQRLPLTGWCILVNVCMFILTMVVVVILVLAAVWYWEDDAPLFEVKTEKVQ